MAKINEEKSLIAKTINSLTQKHTICPEFLQEKGTEPSIYKLKAGIIMRTDILTVIFKITIMFKW